MRFAFNPTSGLIIVSVRIDGPTGHTYAELALDTGATATLIHMAKLVSIGYDPATTPGRVLVTTASSVEYTPRLLIDRIEALGRRVGTSRFSLTRCRPPRPWTGFWGWTFFAGTKSGSTSETAK